VLPRSGEAAKPRQPPGGRSWRLTASHQPDRAHLPVPLWGHERPLRATPHLREMVPRRTRPPGHAAGATPQPQRAQRVTARLTDHSGSPAALRNPARKPLRHRHCRLHRQQMVRSAAAVVAKTPRSAVAGSPVGQSVGHHHRRDRVPASRYAARAEGRVWLDVPRQPARAGHGNSAIGRGSRRAGQHIEDRHAGLGVHARRHNADRQLCQP
jgi:hypothetical protein